MKTLVPICCILLAGCAQQKAENNSEEIDSSKLIHFDPTSQTDPYEYFKVNDTNRWKYTLPKNFTKPDNWKKKEQDVELYGDQFPDSLKLTDVLTIIDTSSQFWSVCQAKSWCIANYQEVFPHLIARLSVKEKIGLRNTADLIIHCRMHTGDLEFYGHGGVIDEDLFTTAGRASWILNQITGEKFVSVQGNMTQEEASAYKTQWLKYVEDLET